tara:strand:+ start:21036 stop:21866 length:831 start_codon:yes stop_codon:yes gene_type:complete
MSWSFVRKMPSSLINLLSNTFEVSNRGETGVSVFVQDQTLPILTVPFLQTRAPITLAADTVVNSNNITLVAGHGVLVGEVIELADTLTMEFMQADVIEVNVNVIKLDQPVNKIYTIANTTALRSTKDMIVNGSITQQIFSVLPLPSQSGDMVRVILELRGTDDMDFTTFGSDPELINGCVIRINNGDGTYRNLFNFKSNSDFFEQGFDHAFMLPKQGGATKGFASRVTWGGQSKHGVVIRVDGALGEAIELVIQDDLTLGTNTRFHLTAQGHALQG